MAPILKYGMGGDKNGLTQARPPIAYAPRREMGRLTASCDQLSNVWMASSLESRVHRTFEKRVVAEKARGLARSQIQGRLTHRDSQLRWKTSSMCPPLYTDVIEWRQAQDRPPAPQLGTSAPSTAGRDSHVPAVYLFCLCIAMAPTWPT